MRSWRVGSFSMGGALILLGVSLLLQQIYGWDSVLSLVAWVPILLIILGGEILFYLIIKGENAKVTYDFVSIFFICIIGTIGIGFTLLNSTGIFDFVSNIASAEIRELDLPTYEDAGLQTISRVQVETASHPLTIEGTTNQEVTIFGTYRGNIIGDKPPINKVSDYAHIEKKGDTLYIKLKEAPHHQIYGGANLITATLLIPTNLALNIDGNYTTLNVKPRELHNDWTIVNGSTLNVDIEKGQNLKVNATNIETLYKEDWKQINKNKNGKQSASQVFGKGNNQLTIKNAEEVEIK